MQNNFLNTTFVKDYKDLSIKFLIATLFAATLFACNEKGELGLEVLPGNDLIKVQNAIISDQLAAYTFTEDDIVTSSSSKNLLGSMNDPKFGNTTAHFGVQFRLTYFPEFGSNPVADSTKLFLFYRVMYGDTITPQHFKVYELTSPLDPDENYTNNVDLKSMASATAVGEIEIIPTIELDSTTGDTLYQTIAITLDNSLGQRLLDADSTTLSTNDNFLEFFKGLYIESEEISGSMGALLALEAASTSSFQGSALLVYYNNDSTLADPEMADSSLYYAFRITSNSARVSQIQHDYSSTSFFQQLNKTEEVAANIYVQPTGGLKAFITMDGLESWKDSTNIAINKAELVFQVDTIASDIENFPPPSRLTLTYVNKDGDEKLPVDYYFSPLYYNGYLTSDYEYRFNITQHLQRLIEITDPDDDNYVGNQGFFLTTGQRADIANRVILQGPQNKGIKLIITYSKYYE